MNLVGFFRAGLNFRGVARRGGRGESGRLLFACLKCGTSGRLSSDEESAVRGREGPAAEIWEEVEGRGVGRAAEGWKVEGSGVGRAAGAWKVEVGRVGSGIESICTAGLGKAGEIRSSKREAEAEAEAAAIWKEAEGSGVGRAAEGLTVEGSGEGRAAEVWNVEGSMVGRALGILRPFFVANG